MLSRIQSCRIQRLSENHNFWPSCSDTLESKVLDSEGNEVAKPPFLPGDAISANDFIMITEDRCWLRAVDGRMMFLSSMVRRYSICDFQYELTIRITGKVISAFQGGVAFRYFDHQ